MCTQTTLSSALGAGGVAAWGFSGLNVLVGSICGLYSYAESSGRKPGDVAMLYSTVLPRVGPSCTVSFMYHMFGSGMGSLELQALVGDANTAEKWSQEGAEKCTCQLSLLF